MTKCAVGYSNILFGLMILKIWIKTDSDHPYQTFRRVLKVHKMFVPWLLMILIQIMIPQASFIGHLTGILAALLIRFTLLNGGPNHGLYPGRVL